MFVLIGDLTLVSDSLSFQCCAKAEKKTRHYEKKKVNPPLSEVQCKPFKRKVKYFGALYPWNEITYTSDVSV